MPSLVIFISLEVSIEDNFLAFSKISANSGINKLKLTFNEFSLGIFNTKSADLLIKVISPKESVPMTPVDTDDKTESNKILLFSICVLVSKSSSLCNSS